MRKYGYLIISVFLITGCVFDGGNKDGGDKTYSAKDYFPIYPGLMFEYNQVTYATRPYDGHITKDTTYYKYVFVDDFADEYDSNNNCKIFNADGKYEELVYSESEVYNTRYYISDNKLLSLSGGHQVFFDFNVNLGESIKYQFAGNTIHQKIISDNELVTVPAGFFENCMLVEVTWTWYYSEDDISIDNTEIENFTYWIAPGVGIVKQIKTIYRDVNYNRTKELVSYSL